MNASGGVVAALATLVAVGASAREPDVHGMKVWTQPGYTVYSHDDRVARTVITEVARIEPVLAKLLNQEIRPSGLPTYVLIVRPPVWNHYVRPSRNIVGEFAPGRFANYLLLNSVDFGNSMRSAIYHEYTHLFLHTQVGGAYPLWFDEGLAQIMGNTQFSGSHASIGMTEGGVMLGNDREWIPISRLFRIDKKSPEYLSEKSVSVHRESWGLVHRGLIAEPEFGTKMFAYLHAVGDGAPVDEAIQNSFGMSSIQLDRKMSSYTQQVVYRFRRVELERQESPRVVAAQTVPEIDALQMLARMMFDTGFNPKNLSEVVDAAERQAPGSTSVRVLRLRLAVRDRDDATMNELLKEFEPGLGDAGVARDVGLALFERDRVPDDSKCAGQRLARQQKALELLDHALREQPQDPEAVWAFGMLAASTNQLLGPALQRLLATTERVTRNADIALATALVYESLQKPELMISALADVGRFSRSLEQSLWARERIDEIRQTLAR
jgi:hypothetical protein